MNIDRIKELSVRKGIKLGKIQADLGEDSTYFSKVKKGLRKMDDQRIRYIADILNTTPEYLTGRIDDSARFPKKGWLSSPKSFNLYRFEQLCKDQGRLVSSVETQLHLMPKYFKFVEANPEILTDNAINAIAALLNTTYGYLTGQTDDPSIPADDKTGVKIGVFGDVAAGIPIEQIENFDPEDPDSWEEINRWTAKNGTYFALKIKGDSMEPRFLEGDVVIVRHQPIVESGEIAVVAINGNTATCKKVVWDENNGMFLIALNQKYPPRYFSSEEIRSKPVTILGKVVELRGKF